MGSLGIRLTLCGCVIAAGCLVSPVRAAEPDPPVSVDRNQDEQADLELGEILVSGAKPNRDPQQIIEWIRRLIGNFSYSGYVESGDATVSAGRRPVRGLGQCKPFGFSPAVMCEMNVTWPAIRGPDGAEIPGGKSTLRPAVFVLGLDPDRLGVRYLEVDNKGMGNGGRSYLRGDSVTTTTPCVDMPPNCLRTTRIHAQPDGKIVRMQFDIEQDSVRIARFDFMLNRIGPDVVEAAAPGRQP